jgi:transcriptional regulator with XRE-family HTH domain
VAVWPRLRDNLVVATRIDHIPALGRAVAARRRAIGKTQEDLAYEADVSLRHLQKIEAGATNPRLGTLFSIAAVLGIRAHQLLAEAEGINASGASPKAKPRPR